MTNPREVPLEAWDDPHPLYVVWELTLKCDQACKHCGSRAGLPRGHEVSTDEAREIIRQLAEIGVREVTLIGGEAYLREDWIEIIEAIRAAGMRCSLVSGGRQLSLERARQAAQAGVYSASISVDGLRETHDGLRAVPGSWDRAMAALQAVRAAGIIPTVNSQINALNHAELHELGEVLVSKGVRAWQLQLTTPMGRAADQDQLVLQPYELPALFDQLAALSPRLRARGLILMASNNLGYYGPHEHMLRPGSAWMGCPAGRFSLGLQSDGRLKACSSLPTAAYADARPTEVPLAEIVDKGPNILELSGRTVDDLWGFCRTCYYAETCLGGCPWTAHTYLGRPGNNPFCVHRAMELARQGKRERVVPVRSAPGERFDHGLWEIIEESAG